MKILILGAGKMGAFFTDILSFEHETAVYDVNPRQLKFLYQTYRFTTLEEIQAFQPELVINAATVKYTLEAFLQVLPVLPPTCILSDIASVKTGLQTFYEQSGFRFVSTHPMFGPTFAHLNHLAGENAILIREGDPEGRDFFRRLYESLQLHLVEYSFEEHDEAMAYSLSNPYLATFLFAATTNSLKAPGTTYRKHQTLANGVLNEDTYLLQEILFNPHTAALLDRMQLELQELQKIIKHKDTENLQKYLIRIREHIS